VRNFKSYLLSFIGDAPIPRDSYSIGIDAREQRPLVLMLDHFMMLLPEGLIGEVILQTFFGQRIQPLRVSTYTMWLYAMSVDPTCESAEEMTNTEVDACIKRVIEVGVMADISPHLAPLH
jgi:hypothetical protein